MRLRSDVFWLHKAGNAPDDYEDAYWPERALRCEAANFRFAVADGATETSFSGLWARQLVSAYGRRRFNSADLARSLQPLQNLWRAEVNARPLPWYAEEKARSGAFSSLLGLQMRSGRWTAVAAGDSCLFLVRDDLLDLAFPVARADDFDSRPHLISSNPGQNGALRSRTLRTRGDLIEGDALYLMTDAIACWFLRRVEAGEQPWRLLEELMCDPARFAACVAELRTEKAMRNDDVTVVRIEVLEGARQEDAVADTARL